MTAIAEFEQKIASQRFSSFQQLQENLKDFSDVCFAFITYVTFSLDIWVQICKFEV